MTQDTAKTPTCEQSKGLIEVTIKIYPEDLELLQTYHQLSGLKSYGLESDVRIAALAFLQERIYEYRKVEQALRKVEQTLHAATPQPEPLTTPQPDPIPAWLPTTLPEDSHAA